MNRRMAAYQILCYRGYANETRAYVYGRVVEELGVTVTGDRDSMFRNLLNTWRRADSDPYRFAEVEITYGSVVSPFKADDEGFFGGWIEARPASGDEWQSFDVKLAGSAATPRVIGSGEILLPASTAKLCIVSDIDDTVIQSRVSNFLQAARTVMLGNSRTRLPFPGVSAFYQALHAGAGGNEKNPIFYVSSSPWNIFDVIAEFMDIQKIPKGPLILRDWDINLSALQGSRHMAHKGVAIRNLLQLYPDLQLILVGDTSQHDPEIYSGIVSEFPNRVAAIYIRDVNRDAERKASVQKLADEVLAAGSSLVLTEDTLGAAKHAAEHGWIDRASLPDIHEEKRADEGHTDEKVAAPDGGEPAAGVAPAVIE
jgi:phosphatidate phosphatase APP1